MNWLTVWIHSKMKLDKAGAVAQDFCDMYGFNQLVGFPTRGLNTLDLIMTPFQGAAAALPNMGTSDHVTISFTIQVEEPLPVPPINIKHWDWIRAPWNHIRGAVRRALKDWNACQFDSVDDAIEDRHHPHRH